MPASGSFRRILELVAFIVADGLANTVDWKLTHGSDKSTVRPQLFAMAWVLTIDV